jgi:hypothetical protein
MAPSPRGLVIVLTFWVVAWPASSIRTGSPFSGWWGTREALALRQAARAPTFTGDFAEFDSVYRFDYRYKEFLRNSGSTVPAIERLEMRLTEMESHAGLGSWVINAENFLVRDSLSLFHQRLRDFEMLLSFGLGEQEYFLWAVTRNGRNPYRLPHAAANCALLNIGSGSNPP